MSNVKKDTAFYDAMLSRGTKCNTDEFRALLDNFGDDDEAVAALQTAVDDLGKTEDRGSYCENASPGYADYVAKKKMLEDFRLGLGDFKRAFNAKATSGKTPGGKDKKPGGLKR